VLALLGVRDRPAVPLSFGLWAVGGVGVQVYSGCWISTRRVNAAARSGPRSSARPAGIGAAFAIRRDGNPPMPGFLAAADPVFDAGVCAVSSFELGELASGCVGGEGLVAQPVTLVELRQLGPGRGRSRRTITRIPARSGQTVPPA
jgi:hypothetical protein